MPSLHARLRSVAVRPLAATPVEATFAKDYDPRSSIVIVVNPGKLEDTGK